MAAIKALGLGTALVAITGCQSWQYRDIEQLPPPASNPHRTRP